MKLTAVLRQSWLQESGITALGYVGNSCVAESFRLLFRGLSVADGIFATLLVGSGVDELEALAERCRSAESINALGAGDMCVLYGGLVGARLAQHVGVGELGHSGSDL